QAMAVHGALMADSDNGAPQAGLRFAEAPVTGSPAAGSPAAGLPATGSPANGLPAIASPAAGLLVAVRDVRFHASRLDDVPGDLICDAVRMAGDATTALYEFEVRSERKRLLHGRATVVFDATLYTSRRLG
ncbi:MAG TPA: hypothetical protein VKP66_17485, partial [Steroidobacteraceae bacterium]|nr:hypothetical protein [Steroidobacteraceae bacterium]